MFHVHRDREGNQQFIAAMDDNHLMNTILFHLKQVPITKKVDEAQLALFGVKPPKPKMVRKTVTILYPYIVEMWFRNLDKDGHIRTRFQQMLGRTVAADLPMVTDKMGGFEYDSEGEEIEYTGNRHMYEGGIPEY